MSFNPLPRTKTRLLVPPLKCQGIKTKLVKFILNNIQWDGRGRWVEPFLGSGVVLFNAQPARALVSDINPHIIVLYQKIYDGALTSAMVREHLTREGQQLLIEGEAHYYKIRERFNQEGNSLDFLFLNRSCFNGLMRFNQKGKFNVPFCRKPERFRPAYVTKIVNQVSTLRKIMLGKQWEFRVCDWRESLEGLQADDFVYLDPPYIGRHTDYYEQWSNDDALALARITQALPCGFAASMWKENQYRFNTHLTHWEHAVERTTKHFYHVGSIESLRHAMAEALLIKPGYEATILPNIEIAQPAQSAMTLT